MGRFLRVSVFCGRAFFSVGRGILVQDLKTIYVSRIVHDRLFVHLNIVPNYVCTKPAWQCRDVFFTGYLALMSSLRLSSCTHALQINA